MKGLFLVLFSAALGLVASRYGASFWLILAAGAAALLGVWEWIREAKKEARSLHR